MTRRSRLRTFTSLIIIGACAYTIAGASTILRYSLSSAFADKAEGAKSLSSYVNVFPVGYLARQRLAQWASQGQPAQMIEPFASLLSETPADGAAWLTLAEAEAFAGKPTDQVVRALAMSSLTAPSESRVMTARAVFTLQIWNYVPPEARTVFISDLVWSFDDMSKEQVSNLRAAFARLPEEARRGIVADLQAAGKRAERPLGELLDTKTSAVPP
jgi:hypothetical protein